MKKTIQTNQYIYRITWSEDDNEFVGLCVEFPSLSYLASSPQKALSGIMNVVEEVVKDMIDNNETIPEPLNSKHYSGKFMVRVPPEVHRQLAIEAAEENISLNRLISSKLS
ncbi:MAG: toxin-antitoxin system HicB family antitoxin [Sedimentisphaerales bacterium]|nr:toxin-antitoxin system HicB family antitoxin [Sedimentisphaerales bacterium]